MEQNKLTVYSHNKVWRIEQKFYSVGKYVFDIPIPVKDAAYFGLLFGIMYILHITIPLIAAIPGVIKFALFPFGLSQFLLKMKLDGKPPHKFVAAWFRHVATGSTYVERFAAYPAAEGQRVRLTWLCSRGNGEEDFRV